MFIFQRRRSGLHCLTVKVIYFVQGKTIEKFKVGLSRSTYYASG